jgi:hypothetical protein
VLYASAWDPGRLVLTAGGTAPAWTGAASMAELESTVAAVARLGIDSDVEIGGEAVPVRNEGDTVVVRIGPFRVTGTGDEWQHAFDREKAEARPLTAAPAVRGGPWSGDVQPLSVTDAL